MKKTIKYIFALAIGFALFTSCEDPYAGQEVAEPGAFEQPALQDGNFTAAVTAAANPLTVTSAKLPTSVDFITVTSKPTLLDTAARYEYKVILSNLENFSVYKTINTTLSGSNLSSTYKQLNDTLKALNPVMGEHNAYARVLAYIVKGGTKALYTTANLPFKVTTYNYPPVAINDLANMPFSGGTVTIDVLANDTDPEMDVLSVISVGTPAHGTASISDDGKKVLYTPTAGYSGSDFFSYTISDGHGNTSTANVDLVKPLYPDHVYMIGAEFGSWDWGNPTVVEMTPVNGNPDKFWAVRYFANPADGFKWNTTKAWGGDFFSLGTDVGFTTGSGNAFVSTAGFYIVVLDYTNNKITIEPAQVYGMGTSFGGWNTGQYPFVADGNVMKLTTTADGDIRMYANSSAAGVGGDWWRMEFVVLDGKIAYRGNGGDQPRANVPAGKVVTLDFNNGTGTIQ